jgi:hypothetical protein
MIGLAMERLSSIWDFIIRIGPRFYRNVARQSLATTLSLSKSLFPRFRTGYSGAMQRGEPNP